MNSTYQAYLLRFQRNETQQQWRVTIQNVNTGEQLHFVTEQELFRYLGQALAIQLPSISQPSAKQS